ncbi:MAG: hypothetical protein R2712_00210 [Vicinamibacterales bacterium]
MTVSASLLAAAVLAAGPVDPAALQPAVDSVLAVANRVAARIEAFTGPVDRHCGIYLLATPDTSASRRDVSTALRCLAAAKRRGRPSWALWQTGFGFEGPAFAGAATSPVSDTHLVSAGRGMTLSVTLAPCLSPRVQKDATIACGNRGGRLTAGELSDALGQLRRDVSRTLGESYEGMVDQARQRVAAGADVTSPGFLPAIVDDVQRAVEDATDGPWPVCPIHHDHSLEHRDRHWLCSRDGVFVGRLGTLPRPRRQDHR